MSGATKTGGCLCGGVRYCIDRVLRGVVNCFCAQCRRSSGHHVAATQARRADLHLESDRTLKWYRSSEKAQRGFCGECGGNLFWRHDKEDTVSIMAGSIDAPTGLRVCENLHVEDASDYQIIPVLK
ncbi:MAG: GFA family protein [Gammaproteobacteria bacterium]